MTTSGWFWFKCNSNLFCHKHLFRLNTLRNFMLVEIPSTHGHELSGHFYGNPQGAPLSFEHGSPWYFHPFSRRLSAHKQLMKWHTVKFKGKVPINAVFNGGKWFLRCFLHSINAFVLYLWSVYVQIAKKLIMFFQAHVLQTLEVVVPCWDFQISPFIFRYVYSQVLPPISLSSPWNDNKLWRLFYISLSNIFKLLLFLVFALVKSNSIKMVAIQK